MPLNDATQSQTYETLFFWLIKKNLKINEAKRGTNLLPLDFKLVPLLFYYHKFLFKIDQKKMLNLKITGLINEIFRYLNSFHK